MSTCFYWSILSKIIKWDSYISILNKYYFCFLTEDSSSALAEHNAYVANISESLKCVARNQLDQMRVMCENHRRTNSLFEELNSILKTYFGCNSIPSASNQVSSVQHAESDERVESVVHDSQPMRLPSPTMPDTIDEVYENEEMEEMDILKDEADWRYYALHQKIKVLNLHNFFYL